MFDHFGIRKVIGQTQPTITPHRSGENDVNTLGFGVKIIDEKFEICDKIRSGDTCLEQTIDL